jgi:membrane-associated phospholipid phosphatase
MAISRIRIAYVAAAVVTAGVIAKNVKQGKTAKLDARITKAVQSQRNPLFSKLMHLVSWPGFPPQSRTLPLIFPALIALFGNRFDALFQLAGWGTSAISGTLKQIMRRPRPDSGIHRVSPARIGGTSFPSGHVINYVGIYGFLAYLAGRRIGFTPLRRLVISGLSAMIGLVGLSRIYLGHHWFTDVVTSYLLGSSYLVALISLYRKLERTYRQ